MIACLKGMFQELQFNNTKHSRTYSSKVENCNTIIYYFVLCHKELRYLELIYLRETSQTMEYQQYVSHDFVWFFMQNF